MRAMLAASCSTALRGASCFIGAEVRSVGWRAPSRHAGASASRYHRSPRDPLGGRSCRRQRRRSVRPRGRQGAAEGGRLCVALERSATSCYPRPSGSPRRFTSVALCGATVIASGYKNGYTKSFRKHPIDFIDIYPSIGGGRGTGIQRSPRAPAQSSAFARNAAYNPVLR